jgi:hypothetical protein
MSTNTPTDSTPKLSVDAGTELGKALERRALTRLWDELEEAAKPLCNLVQPNSKYGRVHTFICDTHNNPDVRAMAIAREVREFLEKVDRVETQAEELRAEVEGLRS